MMMMMVMMMVMVIIYEWWWWWNLFDDEQIISLLMSFLRSESPWRRWRQRLLCLYASGRRCKAFPWWWWELFIKTNQANQQSRHWNWICIYQIGFWRVVRCSYEIAYICEVRPFYLFIFLCWKLNLLFFNITRLLIVGLQTPRSGYTEPPPTEGPTPGYDDQWVLLLVDESLCEHLFGGKFSLWCASWKECILPFSIVLFQMSRLHMVIESPKPTLLQGVPPWKFWKYTADNPFRWQGYDTYSYEANYYGLSFEMAREFCQVSLSNL